MERSSCLIHWASILLLILFVLVSGYETRLPRRQVSRNNERRAYSPMICSAKQFYCSRQRICIHGDYRCDNERDCRYGEDEVGCVYALNNFKKIPNSSLKDYYNRESYASATYSQISDEMCAKKCAAEKQYRCKSFVYDTRRNRCTLSKWTSSKFRQTPSVGYDYYELKHESKPVTAKCGKPHFNYIEFEKPEYNRNSPFTRILPDNTNDLGNFQQQKVVGGYFVKHGTLPWQVRVHELLKRNSQSVEKKDIHHCGATVISEFWLLTAAHCFIGRDTDEFDFIVGDNDQTRIDLGEQKFQAEGIFVHEQYDRGRGIEFNSYVQPACLPDSRTSVVEGTKCWVSGWGIIDPDGSRTDYSQILKADEVPIISRRQCQRLYAEYAPDFLYILSERSFCAGHITKGSSTCYGDSGGPVICKIADAYTIIGITSCGAACARPFVPGVFASVPPFAGWIDQQISSLSKTSAERTLPSKPYI